MKNLHLIDLDYTLIEYDYTNICALNQSFIVKSVLFDAKRASISFDSELNELLKQSKLLSKYNNEFKQGYIHNQNTDENILIIDFLDDLILRSKIQEPAQKKIFATTTLEGLKHNYFGNALISSHWKALFYSFTKYLKILYSHETLVSTQDCPLSNFDISLITRLKKIHSTYHDAVISAFRNWVDLGFIIFAHIAEEFKKHREKYITNLKEVNKVFELIKQNKNSQNIFVLLTASNAAYTNSILKECGINDWETIFNFCSVIAPKPRFYSLKFKEKYEKVEGFDNVFEGGCYKELIERLGLVGEDIKVNLYEDAFVDGILSPAMLNDKINPVFIDRFNEAKKLKLLCENGDSVLVSKNLKVFKNLQEAFENILSK